MAKKLYNQNRGSNGRFDSGFTQNGRNGLLYYDAGELRKITGQDNNRIPTSTFTTITGSGNGYSGPGYF
jgi:hypothetical protein